MGILKKLFGGGQHEEARPAVPEVDAAECPHTALAPHWDEPDDMGKPELATYTCESCGRTFAYEEAKQFLEQPPPVILAAGRAPEPHDDQARDRQL